MNRKILTCFALAVSAFLLAIVGNAQASFPGQNGQLAYVRGYGANAYIYISNPDGSGERLLAQGVDPDWSPTGRKIAFVRSMQVSTTRGDIYTINADGTGITRLTYDGHWGDPAWSPDGTQIAATYVPPGTVDIRIINVADRRVIHFASGPSDHESQPAWSPDGSKIAFAYLHRDTVTSTAIAVWQLNADGDEGKLRLVPGFLSARAPDWTPDGLYLAYSGDQGIQLVKADGSEAPRPLMKRNNRGTSSSSWSPDGTKITFTRNDVGVYVANSAGSGETRVAEGRDPDWGASCPPVGLCLSKG